MSSVAFILEQLEQQIGWRGILSSQNFSIKIICCLSFSCVEEKFEDNPTFVLS